ncbi:hypothetical protein [Leptospira yasudae]|nr:hypothetical protein [Leptospira yasudae]
MKEKYSILLMFLACALYPGATVFAEGETESNSQYAPWSLKAGGGLGEANEARYNENRGQTNNYRVSAEYNPRYFGFEFGLTRKIFSLNIPDRWEDSFPILLLQAGYNINSNMRDISNQIFFNGALEDNRFQERNNFSMTFLDIGPTFHMRPGKTFDPYISIGAGTTGFDRFASYRGFARLGFKLNFDRFFVFTEAEGSAINRYYSREMKINYNDYSGMIGLGFHFGGGDETTEPPKKEESTAGSTSF